MGKHGRKKRGATAASAPTSPPPEYSKGGEPPAREAPPPQYSKEDATPAVSDFTCANGSVIGALFTGIIFILYTLLVIQGWHSATIGNETYRECMASAQPNNTTPHPDYYIYTNTCMLDLTFMAVQALFFYPFLFFVHLISVVHTLSVGLMNLMVMYGPDEATDYVMGCIGNATRAIVAAASM